MNRATGAAFATGYVAGARRLGKAALAEGRGDAAERVQALNTMGFLLLQTGEEERSGLVLRPSYALKTWAATGQMTPEERAFIEAQAGDSLLYGELASYSAQRVTQFGNAELVLAYAEVLQDPNDKALRARAWAKAGLEQWVTAEATLQQALRAAEVARGGQEEFYLVLEDLAANAWQRGQMDLAQRLYAAAKVAYQVALAAGFPAQSRIDQAIGLQNRARLAIDRRDADAAQALMDWAWALFQADQAAGGQKATVRALEISLLITEAGVQDLAGQGALALAGTILPEGSPDMTIVLEQAADVQAHRGDRAAAMVLLRRAVAINAATLPPDTPQVLQTEQSLAELALLAGDRPTASAALRVAAQGRKSPAYRANLAEGADSFEMLSWALLDQPAPDAEGAFEALQWTQITGSAETLAQLQQRLAARHPNLARLIRHAQALQQRNARDRSDLLAAYAGRLDTGPLLAQAMALAQDFARSDDDLAAAGREVTCLATVEPVPLAELQALLAPDEALVTFVLPGLRPGVVAGLQGSPNYAFAVTREGLRFALIPEASRGALERPDHRVSLPDRAE